MRERSRTSGGGVHRTRGCDMVRSCQSRRMLIDPMPALIVLLTLSVAAPMTPPSPPPTAIPAVPDEPGAFVLPDAPILQTVAADLDADGRRELVRLVRGDGEA